MLRNVASACRGTGFEAYSRNALQCEVLKRDQRVSSAGKASRRQIMAAGASSLLQTYVSEHAGQ